MLHRRHRIHNLVNHIQCRCASAVDDDKAVLPAQRELEEAALRERLLAVDEAARRATTEFGSELELGEAAVGRYREQGFLLYPGFVKNATVQAFSQTLDAVHDGSTLASHNRRAVEMEPDQPGDCGHVRRVYEPCTRYAAFEAFARSPLLLGAVSQLLGSRNLMYHYSKVNMKPPQVETIVDWHQDLSYYPLTNRDSVAVLLYLDDADEENGALRVVPREQSRPDAMLDHASEDGFFQGRIPAYGSPDGEDSPRDQQILEAPAGSAIFLGALTPHASGPNRSDRYRRTLIISYRTADNFPLYLSGERYTTEKAVHLISGEESFTARMDQPGGLAVPRYRHAAESIFEIQGRSRRGDA